MSANAQTKGKGGLDAWDQLPKKLREYMMEYPLNMSAEFALGRLQGGASVEQLISELEQRKPRGPV